MNPQIAQINADFEYGDPQTYAIVGAAMKVHRELGHGFLEKLVFNLRESVKICGKIK